LPENPQSKRIANGSGRCQKDQITLRDGIPQSRNVVAVY